MGQSRYIDTEACIQLIGCIIKRPSLFDETGVYFFTEEDFTTELHRVIFGSLWNMYQMGAKSFSLKELEEYLNSKPQSKAVYQAQKGAEWFTKAQAEADTTNFKYNYDRVKKMTLLRGYEEMGLDMSWLLDLNELDSAKRQEQKLYFDSLSLEDIAELIDERVTNIRMRCIDNSIDEATEVGAGIFELLTELEEDPDFGIPMYGKLVNTITRGMREKKFYLRSAPTGLGKTRTMIADACYTACSAIYEKGQWVSTGLSMPVVYISTELELMEIQTMCLAFISDVNEDHILTHKYDFGERERVLEAAKILQKAPLYIEEIPDFSLKDIENIVKRNIRTRNVKYIALDYIHTSMKILEEISRRSGGVKLREDNILFLFGVKLKDICNEFGVFILSSTQLNGDYISSSTPDQNLLRGAKSLGDKIDVGMIMLDVTSDDLEALSPIIQKTGVQPNVKMSIYKNRRGSYNKCYLWMTANKATCRFNGLFVTDYDYNILPIEDTNLILTNKKEV